MGTLHKPTGRWSGSTTHSSAYSRTFQPQLCSMISSPHVLSTTSSKFVHSATNATYILSTTCTTRSLSTKHRSKALSRGGCRYGCPQVFEEQLKLFHRSRASRWRVTMDLLAAVPPTSTKATIMQIHTVQNTTCKIAMKSMPPPLTLGGIHPIMNSIPTNVSLPHPKGIIPTTEIMEMSTTMLSKRRACHHKGATLCTAEWKCPPTTLPNNSSSCILALPLHLSFFSAYHLALPIVLLWSLWLHYLTSYKIYRSISSSEIE